ncbi:MAG TPA: DDE-type integrase/transposase/recombinase [Candidatus Angelobacter sp.]|nr:DDE-type integrase/transposase/recombinase [Candidatus Angelobacter sp.]
MNKLDSKTREQVINCLIEGCSIRATVRVTGVAKKTVMRLLVEVGKFCAEYQDKAFRNLKCKRLQLDEMWSWIYCKDKNRTEEIAAKNPAAGDIWLWVAIDADTKLVPAWRLGSRDGRTAKRFVDDLASRLSNRVQLTTDGHKAYLDAIERSFGSEIDYATLQKVYGFPMEFETRYSPAQCIGCEMRVVIGNPDSAHISTSFVERQNWTVRTNNRRYTRLSNGFSRKIENHAASVALGYFAYNFIKIHRTLRMSPAMAAGVVNRLFEVSDLVELWEEYERTKAA